MSSIEQRIKNEALLDLDIHDVEWFSTYKVHTRHVSEFSVGRCFLAGDAAHVHSPAGAQGMNTGIQDSYNMAWKLALVLKGRAGKKLLATYNDERLENAKNLLQTTDRMFQLVAGPEWFLSFLRTNVVPPIAKYIVGLERFRKFLFPVISQIAIHYPHSPLSHHDGDENFKVKAGDRMPYFLVDGESVYDRLHQPTFHWLVFSNPPADVSAFKAELESEYLSLVDIHGLLLDSHVAEAFGRDEPFSVLLRPDNYIGFLSNKTTLSGLTTYLRGLMSDS